MGDACSTSPKKVSPKKPVHDARLEEALKRSMASEDPVKEEPKVIKGEFSNKKLPSGIIRAVSVANQFQNPVVDKLSEKHETCKATCGYFCTAVARILATKDLQTKTKSDIESIIEYLTDIANLEPLLDEAMKFTMTDRFGYCDSIKDTMTASDRAAYLRDWVANYEISDFIQHLPATEFPIAFLRHNQTPDLPDAKHVERLQIVREEVPFGEDPPFLIELFHPRSLFVSSKKQLLEECEARSIEPKSIVWVVDLNGHFDVAVAAPLVDDADVIFFDSMKSSCCENIAAKELLELL
eukprot:TRINITY_DN1311_c2_g1_i1.p1 TRINITY_DN1311_c2_g1~~TRINITY_DN1311_c2_g1_i1.p1  ORF type:complete len:296 (+),score=54.05 TRINITY_DN1311_c2_g1_i1:48-935(+)